MARRSRRTRLAVGALIICLPLTSCSYVMDRSNGGIGVLEEARSPVRELSLGAKYLGWILAAPLVVALAPVSALLWATPWVDLPLAVDIATAPAIGLGYASQAIVGFPSYGAFAWAEDRPGPRKNVSAENLRSPDLPVVPWGMVVDHRPADPHPRETRPLPADLETYYAVPGETRSDLRAAIAAGSPQPGEPLVIPVEDPHFAGTFELTLADDAAEGGKRPLILMTPPSQANFAARYLAGWYADRGFHTAVIAPKTIFFEPHLDASGIEAKLHAAVVRARAAVSVLAARPDVSTIHYLGVSAGGIFGTLLLATEPGIDRAVLILPGGDLANLVATSRESTVVAYREAWLERGKSPRALRAELRRTLRSEPLRLAPHVNPSRVLLFLGASDSKVPVLGGLALRRVLGSPETYLLAGDHSTAGICFGFVLRRTESFLRGG